MSLKIEFKVTFQPSGRSVFVLPGTTVFEAAARAGLLLQSPCGGKGTCGKCRVRVAQGDCLPTQSCTDSLNPEELAQGMRLACQARVQSDLVVDVPPQSLFDSQVQILTGGEDTATELRPAVTKTYLDLPAPTLVDDSSDLRRVEQALGQRIKIDLDLLRELPAALRQTGMKGTAVVCCDRLIAFEEGDTTDSCYGVAFDVGTTTVVGVLMDLTEGTEVGVAATMNPQISFGDDVISRIMQTRENPETLDEMHTAIVSTMNGLIAELATGAGIDGARIYEVTVAGNTTMQHLFCKITPAALGEVPFPPAFNRGLFLKSDSLGLNIHPRGSLYVFPNIGGFVGGDTVAGILAATLYLADKPLLLVDIGTNGEIILAHDGQLLATSTAAGPAFEGARITEGMRAADGAIEKVVMEDDDLSYNVIGNTQPAGICGTALIDLTAELLRLGVIDETGRVLAPEELPPTVPPALKARLIQQDGQTNVEIVPADQSKTGKSICLYQRDIRELQLASGAIRAGIMIILRKAGLDVNDIHEVLLAGAFGNFIRRKNARRIGLLPNLPTSKIRFIGNAASMGAKAVLLSKDIRAIADKTAAKAVHVDLSADPEFQMEFAMAMMFPGMETD